MYINLCEKLSNALPARIKEKHNWTVLEHPLFSAEEWCGIEIITPQTVLLPEEKASLREIFANHISAVDWMFGFNELRFTDYVNRDKAYSK